MSLNLKYTVSDEVRRNVKKTDIVHKYEVAFSMTIKNSSKIDAVLDDDIGSGYRKRIRCATYGDEEGALYEWSVHACAKNIPLSGLFMLVKAKHLGFALGHDDFKPEIG